MRKPLSTPRTGNTGGTEIMAKVINQELTKQEIELAKELSESEKLSAYLANHAIEHYCDCKGADVDEVNNLLEMLTKEAGVFWRYTCPAIDGVKADGTKLPTCDEWLKLKANEGAVRVDNLAGKQWFKVPMTIADLKSVARIINGYHNYKEAKEGAKKKVANMAQSGVTAFHVLSDDKKAEMLAAQLNCTIEEAKELIAKAAKK